jgi:hypothetical protein
MIKAGPYSQDNYSFILPLCFHELLNVHFKLCVVGQKPNYVEPQFMLRV